MVFAVVALFAFQKLDRESRRTDSTGFGVPEADPGLRYRSLTAKTAKNAKAVAKAIASLTHRTHAGWGL